MLDPAKLKQLLAIIEDLAAGNLDSRFSISSQHDDLDAIGIGVNMLAEELSATIARPPFGAQENGAPVCIISHLRTVFRRLPGWCATAIEQ